MSLILNLGLNFFDSLIEATFIKPIVDNIENTMDRRHVKRQLERCIEAPAKYLESFFLNEKVSEAKVELTLGAVREVINAANVSAKMLVQSSLNTEKLKAFLLEKYGVPDFIEEEELRWPFEMALETAADALCNIAPSLDDWERERWKQTFDTLDRVIKILEELYLKVAQGGEGNRDERFAHTYFARILRRQASIDISALRVAAVSSLDFNSVFVMPDVTPVNVIAEDVVPKLTDDIITLEQARKDWLFTHRRNLDIDTALDSKSLHKDLRVSPIEFVIQNRHCAIIGLPGSGKTTLLQHFLRSVAEEKLIFNGLKPIPVLVKVRELDADALPDFADILSLSEDKAFTNTNQGFLRRQLEMGNVLLLIDGLDEMTEQGRQKLIAWLHTLVDVYPSIRIVISSRPSGYQSGMLQSLGFQEATLREFTQHQIGEYVFRWSKTMAIAEGSIPEEIEDSCKASASAIVDDVEQNPYVARLATNPLMLSKLCLVQRFKRGKLPERRVILYRDCLDGLLFHWDDGRGLPKDVIGKLPLENKIYLLRQLALEMHVNGVAEIEVEQLSNSFSTSLKQIGKTIVDVEEVIENIRNRSGILVERRPRVYGFSHLTFQEYLTALAIHEVDNKQYDRLYLITKCVDPQWQEVIELYCGITARGQAELLIEKMLDIEDDNVCLLCGECIVTAEQVNIHLQEKVIAKLLDSPTIGTYAVARVLDKLDSNIVLECVKTRLKTTQPFAALAYLAATMKRFWQNDMELDTELLYLGRSMLEGKIKATGLVTASLDTCLDHSKAAKVLSELAKIIVDNTIQDDRIEVFHGILQHFLVMNDGSGVTVGFSPLRLWLQELETLDAKSTLLNAVRTTIELIGLDSWYIGDEKEPVDASIKGWNDQDVHSIMKHGTGIMLKVLQEYLNECEPQLKELTQHVISTIDTHLQRYIASAEVKRGSE